MSLPKPETIDTHVHHVDELFTHDDTHIMLHHADELVTEQFLGKNNAYSIGTIQTDELSTYNDSHTMLTHADSKRISMAS